jgi:hypothetical protein
MACANCGSSDVQEVKPSTYFCNHCETVFKHVDPSHVTIEQAFCGCGSAIQVRCNLCHVGLCHACDAKRDWLLARHVRLEYVFVGTEGFGYVIRPASQRAYGVFGNRVLQTVPPFVFGPVVSTNELFWCLPDHGESFHHLCWTCVAAMVPAVAELVSSRAICEQPGCVSQPAGTCRCCGGALCETHMTMLPSAQYALNKADVCRSCVMEHVPTVFASLPRGPDFNFDKARTRRGQLRALKAHDEALRRHNKQLPDVWAQVYALHSKGPCQRDRLVYEGLPADATIPDWYRPFRVLDARPSTPAVALSAVTTYP